jgi:hypothetical protein
MDSRYSYPMFIPEMYQLFPRIQQQQPKEHQRCNNAGHMEIAKQALTLEQVSWDSNTIRIDQP